jgi:hypothetical protein
MSRTTTARSLPLGLSRRLPARCFASLSASRIALCLVAFCLLALFGGASLRAQVAGEGAINGRVTDPSGAVVKGAKVTATNTDTGAGVTRETTGAGDYSISPLQAGTYNVEVIARGFQRHFQENVQVNSDQKVGLDIKMAVGSDNQTVTVTDAPPSLDTTNATLGGTIESELYTNLPLSMNAGPRDPTQFQYLMPGVQEGPPPTSSGGQTQGIYGGSGAQGLNENYIEGIPVSNISAQGDNTPVSQAVSADAVDQFSVQTNGASTAFGGAGVTNYTIKSGGNQFHGTIFDFIRNTMFDTWGYFSKVPLSTGKATKPGEHQNSYGGSLGGPVIKDKLFFFATYEGFHYTTVSNTPQYITIPTLEERGGNFTDDFGSVTASLYDPRSGNRVPFTGLLNGVPTYNVMSQSTISPISAYLQQKLPNPTNLVTVNNYLAGLPLENSDYTIDARLDYTISARNKFSVVGVAGNRGFGGEPDYSNLVQLPAPYATGSFTNAKTSSGVLSYTYVASQTLINSLKYGFTRTWGEAFSISNGTPYNSAAAGILGLPSGNATSSMPSISFGNSAETGSATAPTNWGSSPNSGPRATNSFTIVDNLQWIKGRHNLTFGVQIQWLETNAAGYGGLSNVLQLSANGEDTAGFPLGTVGGAHYAGGSSYASFLLGAYSSGSLNTQSITDVGGRFRPDALYVEDDWRFSPKLTLNLGLRYDYLQPYHEAQNRITFLNPTAINPIVGVPGVLEFAGFPGQGPFKGVTASSYTNYICHCTTPVKPYNKNFEPRLGFAYAATQSFVLRGGFGIQLTHAGGAGGGTGATSGTGNSSLYAASNTYSQANDLSDPAFFLTNTILGNTGNASEDPPTQGSSTGPNGTLIPSGCTVNSATNSCYTYFPPLSTPGLNVSPLQSTGNYNYQVANAGAGGANVYQCQVSNPGTCNPGGINYADPYYGGRGPQYINYNLGFEKMINKKAVLDINYAGSQTHFLPGGSGRGYAQNTFSPDYDQALQGTLQGSAASSAAYIQTFFPNYKLPWTTAGGFVGSAATVAKSLSAFPQYGGFTDLWGDTGNSNSNAVQISVIQRPWHNLSGFINYTRSKEIDDVHGHRTQYPVGSQDGNFTRNYTANQIDRGLGNFNQTNQLNVTWVYSFPIGRGQTFFATNRIAGLIGGGWQLSGIYKYRDGYPLQITSLAGCNSSSSGGQGHCLPDYAPGFDKRTARINGRWGRGPGATAANFNTIQYLNPAAFVCPDSPVSNPLQTCGVTGSGAPNDTWKLGNIASSAPDGLTGPGWWDVDLGIRRTFTVVERPSLHLTFQLEADTQNATNSTFFNINAGSNNTASWENNCNPQSTNSTCNFAYGGITGQNTQIKPRDWQFAGRFRF